MVKVKIINGIYGHKPKGVCSVQMVRHGEVVDLTKTEAKRLQDLGVAVFCEDDKTPPPVNEPPKDNDKDGEMPPNVPPAADPVA